MTNDKDDKVITDEQWKRHLESRYRKAEPIAIGGHEVNEDDFPENDLPCA